MVHHVLDRAQDPPRPCCRPPNSQSGSFTSEADAIPHDELRTVARAGAQRLALVERGDGWMFLVRQIIPVIADIGEFREDEFLEHVAVEENRAVGLIIDG